jgi:hypothetical protein
VQVDPIKPTLKPPGTERLKLKYDEAPSKFAFKFNLRRYMVVVPAGARCRRGGPRATPAAPGPGAHRQLPGRVVAENDHTNQPRSVNLSNPIHPTSTNRSTQISQH